MTMPLFADMGLASPLLNALAQQGFETPTPVQAQIIPQALQGGDWMVSSQTGSGKTLAFLLPILHRLIEGSEGNLKALTGPTALVLCPTRELAQQVMQDAISVLRLQRGIRVASVLGGMPFGKQIAELRGAQLIVATPGRLLDLVNQRKINLSAIKTLVLDEADRMLDLGFAEDLDAIHALCSNREQTLMFSATFMPRVVGLAENIMKAPQRLELAQSHETNANIEQRLCWARDTATKRRMLNHWLEQSDVVQAIVFASTQIDSEAIARALNDDGISAAALHGAMPQSVRNRRLRDLRDGSLKVLVATDVAARGIDVPAISHVINFGLPMKAEDYVHRIGRTGRAGREGVAVTLAEPMDRRKVAAIERYIRTRLPVANVEGFEAVTPEQFGRSTGAGKRPGRGGSGSGRQPSDWPRGEGRPASRGSFDGERKFGDRPAYNGERKFDGERKFGDRPAFNGERKFGDRPAFNGERKFGDRPAFNGERKVDGERKFGDRAAPAGERSFAGKPARPEIRWGGNAAGDTRNAAPRDRKVKWGSR